MSTKPVTPPVGVRLSEDLRKYVESEAKKNFRSTSSEIAMRVERTRQQDTASTQQGAPA